MSPGRANIFYADGNEERAEGITVTLRLKGQNDITRFDTPEQALRAIKDLEKEDVDVD